MKRFGLGALAMALVALPHLRAQDPVNPGQTPTERPTVTPTPRNADPNQNPNQQDPTRREGFTNRRTEPLSQGSIPDQDISAILAICNRSEVEMANFARARTRNQQVMQFADRLAQDHRTFLDRLNRNQFANARMQGNDRTTTNPADPTRPQSIAQDTPAPVPQIGTRPGTTGTTGTPDNRGVAVNAPGVNVQVGRPTTSFYPPNTNPMIALKEEIARECMTTAQKELEQKTGNEFDKCFVGAQIVKHQELIAELNVFQRVVQDKQFKTELAEAASSARQHLEMAKTIMKQLENEKTTGQ